MENNELNEFLNDFYGIDQEIRYKLLSKHCKYFEIENSYWELEDNGQYYCWEYLQEPRPPLNYPLNLVISL